LEVHKKKRKKRRKKRRERKLEWNKNGSHYSL
jgi:hypothetical protein